MIKYFYTLYNDKMSTMSHGELTEDEMLKILSRYQNNLQVANEWKVNYKNSYAITTQFKVLHNNYELFINKEVADNDR